MPKLVTRLLSIRIRMLKSLEGLQYGFETPRSFQTYVINHRILNLSLSSLTTLERFHTGAINTLDIDKVDERYLLSGANDGALAIHDLQNTTGKASYTAQVVGAIPRNSTYSHKYSIETIQWYPLDTGMFVTSGMDCKLKLWDTNSLKPAETFKLKNKIHCHHMSPLSTHHSLIALAMEYPHVVLLDPRSGAYCHELRAHKTFVSCLRWSPTSEYLLATGGSDSKIHLWDIRCSKSYLSSLDQHNGEARGNSKDLITAHNGVVNGLCFTDDGLNLVSCGTDRRLRLWDVALCTNSLVNYGSIVNNKRVQHLSFDICCNTYPPVLFVPSSNFIHVYDLYTGSKIASLIAHFSCVNCCFYRSSSNQLLTAGHDRIIIVWTPDTEREQMEFSEDISSEKDIQRSPANSDAWSSDGET